MLEESLADFVCVVNIILVDITDRGGAPVRNRERKSNCQMVHGCLWKDMLEYDRWRFP